MEDKKVLESFIDEVVVVHGISESKINKYSFNTEEEEIGFLKGLEAQNGWLEYRIFDSHEQASEYLLKKGYTEEDICYEEVKYF